MSDRPKVGEILVSAGIIDEMQLSAALGEQTRWGRRLGVTLIKMGMVEEGHLIRALAKQLGLPVASLAGKRIPANVIALVPSRVASEHGVIPLFVKQIGGTTQLFLGMEDPSNLTVLDDLGFRTGMEIHPVMVGPSELTRALDRYYHPNTSGPPAVDPFQNDDTISAANLRVVTDDGPQPGTAPIQTSSTPPQARRAEPAEQSIVMPTQTAGGSQPAPRIASMPRIAPTPGPNPAETASAVPAHQATRQALPPMAAPTTPEAPEIELSTVMAELPKGLLDDVAIAIAETERTRIVAKAMAQLLISKGLLSLEELQSQIAEVKAKTEMAAAAAAHSK